MRGVIIRRTESGSSVCVAGSMSAKTGVIPCQDKACAVAIKVYEGTITSPVNCTALIAISRATVPLHMATQCLTSRASAIRFSSCSTNGPLFDSYLRSKISFTCFMNASRSPMFGRPT